MALPPIAFKLTKRFCLGLQHHDEALLHHGVETGIIRRLPHGEYIEIEEALPDEKALVLANQIGYDAHSNGHAAIGAGPNGQAANGAGDATKNAEIKRPVPAAEKARLKLEAFFTESRESVPDPHAADEDSPAHH